MKSFAELFTGRDDVHGVYMLPKNASPSKKGKRVGAAKTVREPVTPELYDAHNRGELMLGIVPIRLDGTVMWFVIDVDNYQDDLHPPLMKKINALGLPLVVTKSKSGGAHLWCFLSDPITATQAREVAHKFAQKLGLPENVEIFPKQEAIKKSDEGSWINLPYCGDTRKCVGEDGYQSFTLQQFVEYANARIVHPSDLAFKKREAVEVEGSDDQTQAPPCIQRMSEDGVEEGRRNDAVTQYAIFARRAFPDDWQSRVKEWNDEHVTPRLKMDEVALIVDSVEKHNYQYMCNRFTDICNKQVCLTLKFGIGGGEPASTVILFDRVEWVNGEAPYYWISMFGEKFRATANDLMLYSSFRRIVLAHCGQLLPAMKQPEWEKVLNPTLAKMDRTTAPADTQMRDRVITKFQEWCSAMCRRDDREEAFKHNNPFYDGNNIYFMGDAFMRTIDRGWQIDRAVAWLYLRDWGVMQDIITVGGKEVNVWVYPVRGPLWFTFAAQKAEEGVPL